jgi:preprotein translocase subunit SecB
MSETDTTRAEDWQTTVPEGTFSMIWTYLKDVSFEAPNSPSIFDLEWTPHVDVKLDSTSTDLGGNRHEVVLRITLTATVEEKTAFLVELQQAGIFEILGAESDRLDRILGRFCPSALFPFARAEIGALVARGGFPQMLLAPVNFDVLYAKRLRKRQKDQRN